jgi:hypothetical protein
MGRLSVSWSVPGAPRAAADPRAATNPVPLNTVGYEVLLRRALTGDLAT